MRSRIAIAIALVLATVVAYIPALQAGFIWDDDFYVTDNETLRSAEGLGRIWLETDANPQYYPVTFTSLWLDYQLWGADPFGYHLLNVLLHALAALLLWRILVLLEIPGALLAAWVFALHPVLVESVAWVTERKNVLSGVLYLAAALLYLRFSLGKGGRMARAGPLPALVLFAGALLSKSVTASLPVALALVIVWKRGRLPRRDLPWLGAMTLAGAAMGLLTAWLERVQVGAQGLDWSLTLLQKCLLAGRVFWFYPAKIVWPVKLTFFYERWTVDPGAAWQYVFPLAAVASFAGLFLLRKRIGGGPLLAMLYYTVTISPVLGFLQVFPMKYAWVADHFQYLASIGPIGGLAAGALLLARRVRPVARSLPVAAIALLLALGAMTWKQSGAYRDLETLWRHTVERNPGAWAAHYALANILDARGELEQAVRHHELALKAKPDYADAHNNLGAIRASQGRIDAAIAHYERAILASPDHPIAHYNLARALEARGETTRAERELREAIRLTPDPSELTNDMWLILRDRGVLGPPPGRAHQALAGLLARRGEVQQAIAHYRRALEEDPTLFDSWTGAGRLLAATRDLDNATYCFEQALRLQPGNATAHLELAIVRFHAGDATGAWREVHQARALGLEPAAGFLRALSARMPDPGR